MAGRVAPLEHDLPEHLAGQWEQLMVLKWHEVIYRLTEDGLPEPAAAVRDFLLFMMLKGVENDRSCRLSVPAHIDEVWHSVLVDPVLYMSLSRIVGIEPVIPYEPMGEYDSDEAKMRRWQAALDKFAELYGRPYTHNYCGGQVAARHQDNYVLTQPPTRCGPARPDAMVEDLKYGVRLAEGIPVVKQRLLFCGTELENCRTVSDYDMQDGAIIHLILILRRYT
ncbi:unnamed protein product [Vitrella brassicaformis CCMP3155]|uniref:Ubiquitin-like domain-containing protein n=1 Tax=Vitrella brassicaformis (strain CCMP3155) TaxID=1169540 RepID=A0A0G4EZ87_VITBC|nr:unnamed protein product [Vitrella brassicaformis CCMP3155]|eukprot:CEM04411.1 unnamed protein product [Vitrella brassicaformis CCMP3155]